MSALAASLLFPQLFGKGSDTLERKILGDKFEYHARVQNLIQTMRSFPEPEYLLHELEELLAGTMQIKSYQIFLLDDTTRGLKMVPLPTRTTGFRGAGHPDGFACGPFFQQKLGPNFFRAMRVMKPLARRILQRDARRQLRGFGQALLSVFCEQRLHRDDVARTKNQWRSFHPARRAIVD